MIDADQVGHEAFRPGTELYSSVVASFGKGILNRDGEIDRRKLGDIVFSDREALERLNGIMHPAMHRIVERKIRELDSRNVDVVVLEAALLIEAGWTDLVDQVWVVECPEETAIDRLCGQKGFSEEDARARIRSQMPLSERSGHADVILRNDSGVAALRERVLALWNELAATNRQRSGDHLD